MSFQIFKFNPFTSTFDSLQDLLYFQEFPIFQGFKALEDIEGVKEFTTFKAFLKTISFLSYYTNFRALFCTNCAIRINSSYLKGHLAKHFLGISNKERN